MDNNWKHMLETQSVVLKQENLMEDPALSRGMEESSPKVYLSLYFSVFPWS